MWFLLVWYLAALVWEPRRQPVCVVCPSPPIKTLALDPAEVGKRKGVPGDLFVLFMRAASCGHGTGGGDCGSGRVRVACQAGCRLPTDCQQKTARLSEGTVLTDPADPVQ